MAEPNQPNQLMAQIEAELQIRQMSEPSTQTKERYNQLFSHVQRKDARSIGQEIADWCQTLGAALTWDSRQQPTAVGVRGGVDDASMPGQRSDYRLLYHSDCAEIEIMVMPGSSQCHIEGDILPIAESAEPPQTIVETTALAPALVSLRKVGSSLIAAETQSDGEGRFQMEEVVPGAYVMQIILRDGTMLTIDSISLT